MTALLTNNGDDMENCHTTETRRKSKRPSYFSVVVQFENRNIFFRSQGVCVLTRFVLRATPSFSYTSLLSTDIDGFPTRFPNHASNNVIEVSSFV